MNSHTSRKRHAHLTLGGFAFLVMLLPLILAVPLCAQPGLVHSGPDGIYVALGNSVLPAVVEGQSYTSYRVERREKGTAEWSEVALPAGPGTQLELEQRLRGQIIRFPELGDITINIPAFWERLQSGRTLRDLGNITRLLPVQLALGVRWLDTTALKSTPYEYRISRIAEDGSVSESFSTPTIVYPGYVDMASLRSAESHGETVSARVLWRAREGLPPSTFRVFRRQGITGSFTELIPNSGDSCCTVSMGLIARGDTIFCSLYDKTVQPGLVYQYYAVPLDFFRNEGRPSDTVSVTTFQMRQVPLPEHMKALSIDTAGIEIRWQLREPSAVHGIVIERGPAIDSGFVELFTAGASDTSFLDLSVAPMQRYYYRLRLIGPGGLRSVPSAVVIGIHRSSEIPTPPYGVRAEAIENGIRLTWFPDSGAHLKGYYVYRGDGLLMPLKQISSLLPPEQGVYVDTSSSLQPARAYSYSVQSESTSHVTSAFSDTVSAVPIMPETVPVPAGIDAAIDGNRVHVSWNTALRPDPSLLGYRLYRRKGDTRLMPVADTLQESWQNYFVESEAAAGETYAYAVRAVSITGDTSAFSATATVSLPEPAYYPPGNLRARAEDRRVYLSWDEILQQDADGLRLYRYERGKDPRLVVTLESDARDYVDRRPGRGKLVSYYLTTVGKEGTESERSRIVSVPLR